MDDLHPIVPTRTLQGTLSLPGDKSIAHRALILGALAEGPTSIQGLPDGADVASTARVLEALGVQIEGTGPDRVVHGCGPKGLRASAEPLDCGNSGTTMRLISGVLAGCPFPSRLIGDGQLSARPMNRILDPLTQMGAATASNGGRAPITIEGGNLRGIEFDLPVASAQIKSCLLLAGLQADGATRIVEPGPSRDHTERMLEAMGAPIEVEGRTVSIPGPFPLTPIEVEVPGDFSSAGFFLVASLLSRQGRVRLEGVGLNPTRIGLLDILDDMGGSIEIENRRQVGGEPIGDLIATPGPLVATEIAGDRVVRAIDEIPLVAVAATQARGTTRIRDASELRVKETDRLAGIAQGLTALGAHVRERPDGLEIEGPTDLVGGPVDSRHDHRIAMALAVAATAASGPSQIGGATSAAISYPGFFRDLEALRD